MDTISRLIAEYERPRRRAISSRFPVFVAPAVFVKRLIRSIQNHLLLTRLHRAPFLPYVIARHSSLLYRKLGDSDISLQENKVKNLKTAISKLNGIVIPPGAVFSFWDVVGTVTRRKGYVDGMLLSNGRVVKGLGGGLCQLSNFLMWIFLHADIEIIERHHHSVDAFPDSGRTLPFGSGATVFSNYVDLKIKNTSARPLQLKLWITDTCLKGQLLSDQPSVRKYHVVEKNHCFVRHAHRDGSHFRFNEIYREMYEKGEKLSEEKIFTNFAPVVYVVRNIN